MMDHDDYYRALIRSSEAFVPPEVQEQLRHAHILIAGAGSIGSPIALSCARAGAEHLTILDPDVVSLENLNRQEFTFDQVDTNKATAARQQILQVNPFIEDSVIAEPLGLTAENADTYVSRSTIVIDAVDIQALDMIWALHERAYVHRVPVLVGYDLAGTALLAVYRYDTVSIPPLNGQLDTAKIEEFMRIKELFRSGTISKARFLDFIYHSFSGPIPPLRVPVEQLREITERDPSDERTYQLGTTSRVLGSIATETIRRILAGEEVRSVITVDIPSLVRRHNPSIASRFILLARALSILHERNRRVRTIPQADTQLHTL